MSLNSERISISIHETENGWYVETTAGTGDTWAEKSRVCLNTKTGRVEFAERIKHMIFNPREYEKQEEEKYW